MQGLLVLGAVSGFFVWMLQSHVPEAQARAAVFTALVASSVALIVGNRSLSGNVLEALRRPNPSLWRMVLATAVLLSAVLLIAPLRGLFHFEALTPLLLAMALGLSVGVLLLVEAGRALGHHQARDEGLRKP